jgi:chromate reductase, NAD(P)H dehydrogenase (quinone)
MTNPHNPPIHLLVFDASLGSESLNDQLATLVASVAGQRVTVDRGRMQDFDSPGFDADVEKARGRPAPAEELRRRVEAAEAFVIVSPEYNGSMPGALKNAIDWVSRARPQPFNGKQGLLLSASPSLAGGNRGLWALRVPLEHLGARMYPDMFSLAQAHQAFDPGGRLANAALQQRLEQTITSFLDLVEAAACYPIIKKQWVEFLGERPDPAIDREEVAPTR